MTAVGIVTQARATSTRLPGKVLIDVGGRTLLEHHLTRLLSADLEVFMATTTNEQDDRVAAVAEALGVPVHRGSEHDVLSRFDEAAQRFALDVVVRVTSDCPLVDGALVADGVRAFLEDGRSPLYLSNALERTFPRGMDFEVFHASALREAARDATDTADREHVTPYLYSGRAGDVALASYTADSDCSHFRLTVDTEDDLRLVRTLIEEHGAAELGWSQLVALLEHNPELAQINAHVEQKKLGE